MKIKWAISVLSVVILVLLIFLAMQYRKNNLTPLDHAEKLAAITDPTQVPAQSFTPNSGSGPAAQVGTQGTASVSTPPSPNKQTPIESLSQMTAALAQYTKPESRLRDLLTYLKNSNQQPILVKDKNEFTGEMNIVRTNSPLPGTRYFHAQYFTGEGGQEFAQHMSFQFRPAPEAMNEALRVVKQTFPNLAKPTDAKDDFMQWDLPNGYVVWVKKMGLSDLQDSRFNAYSKDDVGTVWVAVELKPEENE